MTGLFFVQHILLEHEQSKGAGGGAIAPLHFLADQLTLFQLAGGADYARHITTGPSPIFLDHVASDMHGP